MRKEFQLAICPHCGEESVEIPISKWDTSYESKTGIQGFFPTVNKQMAECRNGCFITRSEKEELGVVDHMWDDDDA